MKRYKVFCHLPKVIGLVLVTSLLCACASLPRELQLPKDQLVVGYAQVIPAPEQYVGQMVRWGGVIAQIHNKPTHTIVEVAYYPLSSSGRPKVDERHSAGRFKAHIPGLADPMVYKKGQAITFVGQLGQPAQGQIGEFYYLFPFVLTRQHVLWQERPEYDDRHFHHHGWPYHHYYGYPYYRPSRWYQGGYWPAPPRKAPPNKTKKPIKKKTNNAAKLIHD